MRTTCRGPELPALIGIVLIQAVYAESETQCASLSFGSRLSPLTAERTRYPFIGEWWKKSLGYSLMTSPLEHGTGLELEHLLGIRLEFALVLHLRKSVGGAVGHKRTSLNGVVNMHACRSLTCANCMQACTDVHTDIYFQYMLLCRTAIRD